MLQYFSLYLHPSFALTCNDIHIAIIFEELHTTTDAGRNFGFANFTEIQNEEEEWHQPCSLFGKTP
jgi:hypothetical protein